MYYEDAPQTADTVSVDSSSQSMGKSEISSFPPRQLSPASIVYKENFAYLLYSCWELNV